MAKKLYRNKTEIAQTIYNEFGNPVFVVPTGTVFVEEAIMKKNLHAFEEVIVPAKKNAK